MAEDQKRDLVLPPGQYGYMQDNTKGSIRVFTGPTVINQSAQDVPTRYDKLSKTFVKCDTLEQARQKSVIIVEGSYARLHNPAKARQQPTEGQVQSTVELDLGRKIVVAGPAMFSLWPGQEAEVIRGHHMRSNQFVLLRIYNEEEARANWSKAVMKPALDAEGKPAPSKITAPQNLTDGKLLIIKGTEASFFIPPTGVTVVRNEGGEQGDEYVREALTLERLEYAILVDENGKKRYETGPNVVFPAPTERFLEGKNDDGQLTKKFRAIELNELQGIHLKVIVDYEVDGKKYKAGEERFVTGKETAIYYPREEEAAVKYDGKVKTFAVAVPKGEGRYVMDRMTGVIETEVGPTMLLPDPRTKVIVQRVLTPKQCALWYPGNQEVVEFNTQLRNIAKSLPTTRNAPSSEDLARNRGKFGDLAKSVDYETQAISASVNSLQLRSSGPAAASANFGDSSKVSKEQGFQGDEFSRSATFTTPRSITLNTKLHGVPSIDVWAGDAVMVVNKDGKRSVKQGPTTILLGYDESLAILNLSTGKPKNTDNLFGTVFLRTINNHVSDEIKVETKDHVNLVLKVVYQVDFVGNTEEEMLKWFSVENYVKLLCDHARSVLKGAIRRNTVEEFYSNSTEIIRGTILNKDGGMPFDANNMLVKDVEVLSVQIQEEAIRKLLEQTQLDVIKSNIELEGLERTFNFRQQQEELKRADQKMVAEGVKMKNTLDVEVAASALSVVIARTVNHLTEVQKQKETLLAEQANADLLFDADLRREQERSDHVISAEKERQDVRLQALKAETDAAVARFGALSGNFSEALLALSSHETMVKVAQALNVQRIIGGDNIAHAVQSMFKGTPLAPLMEKIITTGQIAKNGSDRVNGS